MALCFNNVWVEPDMEGHVVFKVKVKIADESTKATLAVSANTR
jgi:hypothetical protein